MGAHWEKQLQLVFFSFHYKLGGLCPECFFNDTSHLSTALLMTVDKYL
jgi:hypothetical protein